MNVPPCRHKDAGRRHKESASVHYFLLRLDEKSCQKTTDWLSPIVKFVFTMIHYLKNKVGVVDFANAQGVVMF